MFAIKSEDEKKTKFKYFVKELKPSSSKTSDLNKLDNWFFSGDFEKKSVISI